MTRLEVEVHRSAWSRLHTLGHGRVVDPQAESPFNPASMKRYATRAYAPEFDLVAVGPDHALAAVASRGSTRVGVAEIDPGVVPSTDEPGWRGNVP